MKQAFLHVGSNKGNRHQYIEEALAQIENLVAPIKTVSQYYETSPWGMEDQGNFINICLEVETTLQPIDLLEILKAIELKIGRQLRPKWHEREIDIDILYFGDLVIDEETLKIPHPEMQHRNFVLIPLMDVAPYFIHPILGKNTEEMYLECTDSGQVVLLADENTNKH